MVLNVKIMASRNGVFILYENDCSLRYCVNIGIAKSKFLDYSYN